MECGYFKSKCMLVPTCSSVSKRRAQPSSVPPHSIDGEYEVRSSAVAKLLRGQRMGITIVQRISLPQLLYRSLTPDSLASTVRDEVPLSRKSCIVHSV